MISRASKFFGALLLAVVPLTDPALLPAEYLYSKNLFSESYPVWKEIYGRHPRSVFAVMRVAEHKLWLESRESATQELARFAEKNYLSLTRDEREELKRGWLKLRSIFITEAGQSLFFRATPANGLLEQIPAEDRLNYSVLKVRMRSNPETAQTLLDTYPFDLDALEIVVRAHMAKRNYDEVVLLADRFPDLIPAALPITSPESLSGLVEEARRLTKK